MATLAIVVYPDTLVTPDQEFPATPVTAATVVCPAIRVIVV